ncbi:hypothetical protein [Streptomyces antibioticus]|uniref:hypothetical protein n=1 Tax=Streptomyces antibioticus TaxID=1890 RepID=UPI0037024E87
MTGTPATPDETPPEAPTEWWRARPPLFASGRNAADAPETQPPPHEVAPGIHIVIQPQQPAYDPARQRDRAWRRAVRRWLAVHGAAAAAGWALGLKTAVTGMLTAAGDGGVAAGLALALFAYIGAEIAMARYLRWVPPRLRPPVMWALRIPFATALLATTLYTPNALIGAST